MFSSIRSFLLVAAVLLATLVLAEPAKACGVGASYGAGAVRSSLAFDGFDRSFLAPTNQDYADGFVAARFGVVSARRFVPRVNRFRFFGGAFNPFFSVGPSISIGRGARRLVFFP